MKIKVLRDYSGQEGTDVDKNVLAGSEHVVTRARAAELLAVGLVEAVGDDEHPDDAEAKEGEKAMQPIANKAAPTHQNKAVAKPKAAKA
ncbi:hypothetical protein LZK98_11520 [Sphingomonas cannabina]|uniref:hypothetical protein n=1 Tax=Sphingomonas cannabina TaxID=2899123 RepID=UPI001F44FDCB|nr:hypothetical protein [Sphingomonas cannabina]UIJ43719.1 hypothetical protein LZK98_11520 [Sphingomonas cannabina]